jgi:hypothetical protein
MQLSVLIPTHRDSLLACSRIVQACSWAGENIEVIVRDNSGSAQKRELLGKIRRDNCNIIFAEPCGALENFSEAIQIAKGEFVIVLADDDLCFDQAITSMHNTIARIENDQSVAGMTGAYAIETSQGTSIAHYSDVDSENVAARVSGYLSYGGPNVLFYSPLRRILVQRIFAFMNSMPFMFSFHDQVACLLYLLNGKFVRLQRLMYLYDVGVWETTELAQKRDVDIYKQAGLDPGINKLHWFLCAFEGAALILNSDEFPSYPRPQLQPIADHWFAAMFSRFKSQPRFTFGSPFEAEAEKLCAKLRASTGQLSFHGMLMEISGFIARTGNSRAQDYFNYWGAMLAKNEPALRKTGS